MHCAQNRFGFSQGAKPFKHWQGLAFEAGGLRYLYFDEVSGFKM
jgi:hypothetical protein